MFLSIDNELLVKYFCPSCRRGMLMNGKSAQRIDKESLLKYNLFILVVWDGGNDSTRLRRNDLWERVPADCS